MSSQLITESDYRYGIGDKYGRAKCSRCRMFRRINAYWQNTGRVLCTDCSHIKGQTFAESVTSPKKAL